MKRLIINSLSLETQLRYDYDCEPDLDNFIRALKERQDQGATHFEFYATRDWEGDIEAIELSFMTKREETDKEYDLRLQEEANAQKLKDAQDLRIKQEAEQHERELYQRLKEKYGD